MNVRSGRDPRVPFQPDEAAELEPLERGCDGPIKRSQSLLASIGDIGALLETLSAL